MEDQYLQTEQIKMIDEVPAELGPEYGAESARAQVGHTITTYLIGSKNQLLKLLDNSTFDNGTSEAASDFFHDLVVLLTSITTAIKTVGAQVKRMGLPKAVTSSPQVLNRLANQTWINSLSDSKRCCIMVSEDLEEPIIVEKANMGRYAVVFDSLTGTAEPPCEDMGAIFGIFKQVTVGAPGLEDVKQPGRQLVAAGYALYGASTVLMFSIGDGVHGFTLDPTMNEFILTHESVKIPYSGPLYSVNEGHTAMFNDNYQKMLKELKAQPALDGRKRQLRYIGSMVPDIHRTIMFGGVYMYPTHTDKPSGRFKLLYEASPLAFLVEQAGGQATDGAAPILDIIPSSVHHRLPVVLGSEDDVNFVCSLLERYDESRDDDEEEGGE